MTNQEIKTDFTFEDRSTAIFLNNTGIAQSQTQAPVNQNGHLNTLRAEMSASNSNLIPENRNTLTDQSPNVSRDQTTGSLGENSHNLTARPEEPILSRSHFESFPKEVLITNHQTFGIKENIQDNLESSSENIHPRADESVFEELPFSEPQDVEYKEELKDLQNSSGNRIPPPIRILESLNDPEISQEDASNVLEEEIPDSQT